MGTEAAWIPLVVAAVGAGVNQYNTNKTASKRDSELAQGIMAASKEQQKADQSINENLNKMETSRAEPFKKDLQETFLERIQKQKLQGLSGLNTVGDTSAAYKKSAEGAKAGSIDYAATISDLLSGIDAAGNQRQEERKGQGDVSADLLKFKSNSDQEGFLSKLRASGIRDNPWLSIAGAGLSGAAAGMAGGGFGGVGTGDPGVQYAGGDMNPNARWLT